MLNVIKSRHYFKFIGIGALSGAFIYIAPISLVLFFLLGAVFIFMSRLPCDERRILSKIVIAGLALRFLFEFVALLWLPLINLNIYEHPVLHKFFEHVPQLFRDFQREVINGQNLGRFFSGAYGDVPLEKVAFEGALTYLHFSAYFQGFLNFIFGESFLTTFTYPLIGIWMVLLTYYLARDAFGKNPAVVSSFIIAVFPSFVVWSCINLRTAIGIISFLLLAIGLLKFSKRNHLKYIILVLVSLYLTRVAKDKFFLLQTMLAAALIFLNLKLKPSVKKLSLILVIIIGVILVAKSAKVQFYIHEFIMGSINNQRNFANYESGTNYRIYDDVFYGSSAYDGSATVFTLLKALPKGVFYFLFAPFPWRVTNVLRLFAYIQMLSWYFMFLFALRGIFMGIRYNFKPTSCILAITIFWIAILSLVMGNEGTAARQRDLILPFLYIFSSVGLCNMAGKLKE